MQQMTNSYRLSPQQEYLWSLQQSDRSQSYRALCAVLVEGLLESEILRAALGKVVERHEILRTKFRVWPGTSTLLQTVDGGGPLSLDHYDLKGLSPREQELKAGELFDGVSRRPINLEQAPLLHSSLIAFSPRRHGLILSLPALCADATTLRNLVREISRAYEACLLGEDLPEGPLQYVDVSEWQNQLLESDEVEAGREYWRRPAVAAHLGVKLPRENPPSPDLSFDPRRLVTTIPAETFEKIESLVRDSGTSMENVLLACWQLLLWRLTGQSEMTIGVSLEGRKYDDLADVLGPVAQYLPLHTCLKDKLRFGDLLKEAAVSVSALSKRRDYFSWEDVREASGDPAATPFPTVGFGFEEQGWKYSNSALSFSLCKQQVCPGRFEVRVLGVHREQSLSLEFQYDLRLFRHAEVARLSGQFLTLLRSACERPGAAIGALEILDADERQRLLFRLNETRSDDEAKHVHRLFEEQVKRAPQAVAAVFEGQRLTYAGLNSRANQLARHLRRLGAGPETLVGICMERSPEMLAGMLGILKAGGAYVPLDPTYPKQRLDFMLKDARLPILLTQARLAGELPEHEARTICLDSDWDAVASESGEDLDSRVTDENAAYVIYTSGSTGRPKGVLITHGGLANYLRWSIKEYLSEPARAGSAVHSSIGFDLTVTSIFAPLLGGQKVLLLPEQGGIEALGAALCGEEDFSLLKITPSHLDALSQSLPAEAVRRVHSLIIGGEALQAASLSFWRTHAPRIRVVNEYGPTEAVVGCCVYEVPPGSPPDGAVPIGGPIVNTQLYILNAELQPVPVGVTGELYIGGAGLARGYLNWPEQTAEKFIPCPFGDRAGARLYRTGDLARRLAGGDIEFLGRADNQVKVRGHRIELGEIEAVLKQHPSVLDGVVEAREDVAGDRRIVAYVVYRTGERTPTAAQLHRCLAERLPGYMLPNNVVRLKQLPLTAHGKVDRRALPAPEHSRPEIEEAYVAPRTAVESLLAENWAQLLGLERVGIHDNFFELGGHSLLATRLTSRLRNILRVEVPLRKLFDSPTVAGLAEEVEAAMRESAQLPSPPPVRVTRDANAPLSFAQQRLWFLDQLEPDSAAYHIPAAVRMTGRLDLRALEQSLGAIVRRHEALRTTFALSDGEPVQVVEAESSLRPTLVDLSHLPGREAEARRLAAEEARRTFDLSAGPLLRFTLLRLGPEEHVALLTMHHIVSDGWSMEIFVREFMALYEASLAGREPSLPELHIQYRDYAVWQREWLRGGQVLEQQMAYWKRQLGAEVPALELPADHQRPAAQSFRGSSRGFELTPELSRALRGLSHKAGVTLFMTLLAAFQTLLHRYTGQDEIATGTPVAGRTRAEFEGLIGFFVNTLVLRTRMSGNPGFAQLLARVREVALGAYAHQDLPFEKLVEELQPKRDLSRNPLFQVFFSSQNIPPSELRLPGLKLGYVPVVNQTTQFDLSLRIVETPDALQGAFEYSTDLFEPESIERLERHFRQLLVGLSLDPQQPVCHVPLLDQSERLQLLGERNRTQFPSGVGACLHELFEAQVGRTPAEIAVAHEGERLTYKELNSRANQLARHLRGRGVSAEVLVGILMERSVEMVVGALAILKAGGAYVPLDPGYPRERLRLMIEDAGVGLVVRGGAAGDWVTQDGVGAVDVESEWGEIALESVEDLGAEAAGENLAYVIYTSGSTGRPKGVMISHRGVVNFILSTSRQPGCEAGDVLLAVTTLSFDIAVLELFLPLVNGGRVVVAGREATSDGRRLRDKIAEVGPTLMQATPATWRLLLAAGWTGSGRLKILCGGEALGRQLACELLERGAEVWNLYGPTETTVWSSMLKVEGTPAAEGVVSIGRPLANTELYVLDPYMQMLPVGVPGELYIGGAGLARGYWRGAAQTAERFVPNPFSPLPGARLYRTGDVARYLDNGNVQYVGRADSQVKLRGYRIETGEIEVALNQQPPVRESVVIMQEDAAGEKRLVGYVVTEVGAAFSATELRRRLKEMLPDYMIPPLLLEIEKLPLTPNGKVDRRALPSPQAQARPDLEETFVSPRTPVEETVAALWAQVLGLEQVGVNDNFFALGGHSLLATQVISRVQGFFELEVPLRSLFEAPTVGEFARAIEEAQNKGSRLSMPALRPSRRDGTAPLTFAQQRMWFLNQLEPDSTAYNLSAAVRLEGPLNLPALEQSFNQIIGRHETLRTSFAVSRGRPVQVVAQESRVELRVEELGHTGEGEREAEIARLAGEEAQRGFDLSAGSLLRVRLLRLSAQEHVLLLTMHHIISDGWSVGVMVRELGLLYETNDKGREAELVELKIQYGDYAVWQREWLRDEELDGHLSFWERQLEGANFVLELPTDRPRPALQSYRGATHSLVLGRELTRELKALARRENSTLFMILLAAFRALLYRYTGQPDILVGAPIANRTHTEVEPLIGLFANTLVMRADASGETRFRELLKRVREAALGAYAHQDVPFEKVVERLRPARDLSRNPLFQALFAFQNVSAHTLELQGLKLSTLDVQRRATRFDLSLGVVEVEGALRATFEYSTDLFESQSVARMGEHFSRLLAEVVVNPERRLSEFSLLSEAERRQLISEWNETRADYPRRCIHQMFEAQARRTPDAIALSFGRERLTYRQLNERANRLARHLLRRLTKEEEVVGVCLGRSIGMVVSLLAVLKAGAAYLPLDPDYPAERLRAMIEDAGVRVLVSQGDAREWVGGSVELEVLSLDGEWTEAAAESGEDLEGGAEAGSLAYVIYTSGSTGKPKGVQIEHGGVVNLLEASRRLFPFNEHDAWTVFHSFTFDLSVWEIFTPLFHGGRLVIVPLRVAQSPEAFYELLQAEQVTILNQTPSVVRHLARVRQERKADGAQDLKLRLIICGGEALPGELASQLLEWQVPVLNFYGPTEATVWSATHEVEMHDAEQAYVSVGRPLQNTELFILDSRHDLLPAGVPGELYIGGAGLARAYLGRPAETAEKFVPHPFSDRPGARLYRTGDVARHLPDGRVQYLGRADQQVKLRGYRVEPGEIEAVAAQHPMVKECAVMLSGAVDGQQRLVCYVVEETGAESALSFDELRRHLERRLPQYMIPAAMVKVGRMPLTPSDKVDRRALLGLEVAPHSSARSYLAPRDLNEALLVGIWANVLGLERVGVNDNFFELGGHSLLSPGIISQVKEIFHVEMPLRILFESPTVAELARRIEKQTRIESTAESWSPLVAIQRDGPKPPFFGVHPGGGGVSCYRDLARHLGAEQPFYGLQAPEVTNDAAGDDPYRSLEEVAADYVRAVRAAQPSGPYLLGGWSAGGVIAFEMAQQLRRAGQEVALLALLDCMPRSVGKVKVDDGALAFLFAREVAINSKKSLPVSFDALRSLSHDEQLAYLLKQLKLANVLPREMELSWFRQILRGVWARNEQLRQYEPQVYPGRITLFRGSEVDPEFIKAQNALDWREIDARDPTNGWSRFSAEPVEVHEVPGHHYTIVWEPHVRVLAERLRTCIDRAV